MECGCGPYRIQTGQAPNDLDGHMLGLVFGEISYGLGGGETNSIVHIFKRTDKQAEQTTYTLAA